MCGNVGMISTRKTATDWTPRKKWFQDALIVDTVRGADSTGLAAVGYSNMDTVTTIKEAVAGPTFVDFNKVTTLLNNMDKQAVVMGHNRAATKGAINAFNAHPFTYGNITLCHNGTLRTRNGVDSYLPVDSEAICKAFYEKGALPTLELLQGAYALQWYDSKEHTYNLARNDERPLNFAFNKEKDICFVASEAWMIRILCAKHGFDLWKNDVWELNPGYIISFGFDQPDLTKYSHKKFVVNEGGGSTTGNFTQSGTTGNGSNSHNKTYTAAEKIASIGARRKEAYTQQLAKVGLGLGLKVKAVDAKFTPYHPNTSFSRGSVKCLIELPDNKYVEAIAYNVAASIYHSDKKATYTGTIIGCTLRPKGEGPSEVVLDELRPNVDMGMSVQTMYEGPGKKLYTKGEFLKLVETGCCMCGDPIEPADHLFTDWAYVGGHDVPICFNCNDGTDGDTDE